jgi:hypothetical protein
VLEVLAYAKKDDAFTMYEIISEENWFKTVFSI